MIMQVYKYTFTKTALKLTKSYINFMRRPWEFSFKSWNFPTEFLQQLVNNKGRIFKKSFPLESHLVMLN